MKKTLLFLIFLPLFLNAQRSMYQYYHLNMLQHNPGFSFYEEPFAPSGLRKQLQIQSVKSTSIRKNGKTYQTEMTFNKMGKMLHFSDGKRTTYKKYESDTLETYFLSSVKNKTRETKSTYSNGKIVSSEYYKNSKLTSKAELRYNEKKQAVNSKMTKGKKTYEIQNTFDEENKLTKTVFLVNGKLKKQWIYECKPEGQIVASRTEALSSFCTYREESADGSYTTFTRTLKEGKPYLNKQTFSKDSVLILSQTFLKDSILTWEVRKEGNTEMSAAFKKSGKFWYKQVTTFNASGNVIAREFFDRARKHPTSKRTFELNPDGTTKTEQSFYKGKLWRTITYVYSFY